MRVLQTGIVLLIVWISLAARRAPMGIAEMGTGLGIALLAAGYFLTLILEVHDPPRASESVADDLRFPWSDLRDLH